MPPAVLSTNAALSNSTPSSSAQWHTISPHTRPLTLTILELTPLALTLSLSLTPSPASSSVPNIGAGPHTPASHIVHANHHTHAHSPSHGHGKSRKKQHQQHNQRTRRSNAGLDVSDDDEIYDSDYDSALIPAFQHSSVSTNFKDLLSHGVVVSVNGQPWSRIYAHVSEDEDDELEWEDEPDSIKDGTADAEQQVLTGGLVVPGEDTIEEGSMTRRRPRRARFGSSAAEASGNQVARRRKEKERERVDRDRAVVVVYGLSPGKEYEVELRVVGLSGPDGLEALSNSVLIPPSPSPGSGLHPRSRANSLRSRSRPRSRSNSLTAPSSSAAHPRDGSSTLDLPSPGLETLNTEPLLVPTPILNAVDTQAAQLRHLIATAHAEKDHLQTQIKDARRTSQRQEAALKAEIEAVKKAIEKAGSLDLRSKQKALAVQEQVKQGWAGAEAAEKQMNDVESGLDTLESKLEAVRIEVDAVRGEWNAVREKEEEIRERDRKARAEEDKKLLEAASKLDKLKAKRAKKEAETAELEKKLEELQKQCEDAEKKNEDDKTARRGAASYWAAGYGQNPAHGSHEGYNHRLSAHPSLSNISGHYAAGPAYRPRGAPGYQPRFPSAGAGPGANVAGGGTKAQPSPTHAGGFYPPHHGANTSPAFRPPKLSSGSGGPSRSTSGGANLGVNAAALPFHPSNFQRDRDRDISSPGGSAPIPGPGPSPQPESQASGHHTTSLMPPQLQHRIYLPNVRPRPTPNFHPPPSVLAEQHAQAHAQQAKSASSSPNPASASQPAFPPLPPSTSPSILSKGSKGPGGIQVPPGPSLASIVTRAVLSPTSALAQQAQAQAQAQAQGQGRISSPASLASFGLGQPLSPVSPGSAQIPASAPGSGSAGSSSSPTPTPPTSHSAGGGSRLSFPPAGASPSAHSAQGPEFPPLSPTWGQGYATSPPSSGSGTGGMNAAQGGVGREGTPPSSIWGAVGGGGGGNGKESPNAGQGVGTIGSGRKGSP